MENTLHLEDGQTVETGPLDLLQLIIFYAVTILKSIYLRSAATNWFMTPIHIIMKPLNKIAYTLQSLRRHF
jgi:hypothetical protein